jgi:hypothetical protein
MACYIVERKKEGNPPGTCCWSRGYSCEWAFWTSTYKNKQSYGCVCSVFYVEINMTPFCFGMRRFKYQHIPMMNFRLLQHYMSKELKYICKITSKDVVSSAMAINFSSSSRLHRMITVSSYILSEKHLVFEKSWWSYVINRDFSPSRLRSPNVAGKCKWEQSIDSILCTTLCNFDTL